MLRSNLSTRPFYNERAVHLLMALVALLVLGFTAFNVTRIVSLSNRNTDFIARATEAEAQVRQLRTAATRTRRDLDPKEIEKVSMSAREANAIIDRRLLSWTELFNYFETTLPDGVRLTAVRPKTNPDGTVTISISVIARRAADIERFMIALESTRAFRDVLSRDERLDRGDLLAVLEAIYLPGQGSRTPAQQQETEPAERQP